jgi:glycosyltransferase involved in cell wall biosynthesis
MNGPKVSVLIPVYNGERYLAECLDSVLAQDFNGLEVLLSDDGSTDGSVEIIKRYAVRDARIRWWQNPRNVGLTANSNVCLRAARGDFLKFVHQDDLLLSPAAVRQLASALERHPGASLAACRQHLTGTRKRAARYHPHSGCFEGRKVIVASLEQNTNLIGQPALTLFRRKQAQRGFDERFTGFMDFEMWCHLLEQGDFVYLAEELASWRVHEDQQTARARVHPQPDLEHLRFLEIYFAKPWLRVAATDRMLFTQIYYLEKKYGAQARHLALAMRAQLGAGHFAWQWARHKAWRPLQKLAGKLHPR